MDFFEQGKISPNKLRAFLWVGSLMAILGFPTVIWLIRPFPDTDEGTFWITLSWITGVCFVTWSLAGFSWNALMEKGPLALDEPEWDRKQGGLNGFERQAEQLSNSVRYARNWAIGMSLFGVASLASVWGDSDAYTCRSDSDGFVSCTNSMAFGAAILLVGVILIALWAFVSQRFMNYFHRIEPKIRALREEQENYDDF